jgi:AcrR family transcriptional regulator
VRLTACDRREQILDVASSLFARQGHKGTTTRAIARRAGVSEAIVFRHFRNKDDLYWAVIDRKCRVSDVQRRTEAALTASDDDLEVFTGLAREMLRRNLANPDVFRLLLFSALEDHSLSGKFFRIYIAKRYQILAEHISKRIEQGEFRQTDPLLAARNFLGMLVYHFLIQEVFGAKRLHKYDLDEVAETVAELWLQGMQAAPKARPGTRRNGKTADRNGHKISGNGGRRSAATTGKVEPR